jgi:hypothetical protein
MSNLELLMKLKMARKWRGLCPTVDCSRLMMMMNEVWMVWTKFTVNPTITAKTGCDWLAMGLPFIATKIPRRIGGGGWIGLHGEGNPSHYNTASTMTWLHLMAPVTTNATKSSKSLLFCKTKWSILFALHHPLCMFFVCYA